jgi:hypothetical protein
MQKMAEKFAFTQKIRKFILKGERGMAYAEKSDISGGKSTSGTGG